MNSQLHNSPIGFDEKITGHLFRLGVKHLGLTDKILGARWRAITGETIPTDRQIRYKFKGLPLKDVEIAAQILGVPTSWFYRDESDLDQRKALDELAKCTLGVQHISENTQSFLSTSLQPDQTNQNTGIEQQNQFRNDNFQSNTFIVCKEQLTSNHQNELYGDLYDVQQKAAKWANDGYQYYSVERSGKEVLSQFNDLSSIDIHSLDDNTKIFFLVTSIHFGWHWCFWSKTNSSCMLAAEVLLKILNIKYVRPRLRALYALQLLDKNIIQSLLNEHGEKPNDNLQLIINYVLTDSVVLYIEKTKNIPGFESKASPVLQEIRTYCEEGSMGSFGSLPVL